MRRNRDDRDSVLITDFDGTITERDFYLIAFDRLLEPGLPDYWSLYRQGRLTHFEALGAIFASIRRTEVEVRRAIADSLPDPDLAASVTRLRDAGWEVVAASAGCAWYIEQILTEAGVRMEVHANPGRFEDGRGLIMEPPVDSPYFSPSTGIGKPKVLEAALGRYRRVAYAGDGPPDLEPSLMVRPELRFARGWLAEELRTRGEGFRPFRRWSEIALILSGSEA